MLRLIALILMIVLGCGPAAAATSEAFWMEFDVTFWQTMPFAAFWGYALAAQLGHGDVNWSPVLNAAVLVSLVNAYFQARRVTERPRP
jgi:hypothetical protein